MDKIDIYKQIIHSKLLQIVIQNYSNLEYITINRKLGWMVTRLW